jgi:multidrug efflux system outer membrane protein
MPLFPIYSNDYRAVLTASYELDLWGKIRSATEASYAELLGEINARRTVILSVVSSVASSYMLLRQYDWQLQISKQTLRSREESYELAQLRFKEGLTSELEVAQAKAERDEAVIQIIQFQTLVPQQENLLSVLIGHPPTAIKRGLPVDEWQLPPEVPTGLPVDLLEQRPDILQAEEQLKAANFRIGEARALYFPDITLTGYYGYESSELHRLFTDPSRTWQWMANLLQPVFTGWRISNSVDLAKAETQEAVYNYLQVILTALQEVDDALIAHKNAKEAVIAENARVKDYEQYLHLANLQYRNGLVDYLSVLDAERRLFEAQLDLAKAEADVFITLVNIYKALGGGWVIDAENIMKEEWQCK